MIAFIKLLAAIATRTIAAPIEFNIEIMLSNILAPVYVYVLVVVYYETHCSTIFVSVVCPIS